VIRGPIIGVLVPLSWIRLNLTGQLIERQRIEIDLLACVVDINPNKIALGIVVQNDAFRDLGSRCWAFQKDLCKVSRSLTNNRLSRRKSSAWESIVNRQTVFERNDPQIPVS